MKNSEKTKPEGNPMAGIHALHGIAAIFLWTNVIPMVIESQMTCALLLNFRTFYENAIRAKLALLKQRARWRIRSQVSSRKTQKPGDSHETIKLMVSKHRNNPLQPKNKNTMYSFRNATLKSKKQLRNENVFSISTEHVGNYTSCFCLLSLWGCSVCI